MITALVLAAGQSRRMGEPKMLLPWGQTTVIGQVISTLHEAGLNEIRVVTGGNQTQIEAALSSIEIKTIYNPDYATGEMLSSVQVGLRNIPQTSEAALIVLGDQPQIESGVVKAVLESYQSTHERIIVPSYQMHRGHPWLIDRSLWNEIADLKPPGTLRDYLIQKSSMISYVNVNTPSIIQDLDTPADYQLQKP